MDVLEFSHCVFGGMEGTVGPAFRVLVAGIGKAIDFFVGSRFIYVCCGGKCVQPLVPAAFLQLQTHSPERRNPARPGTQKACTESPAFRAFTRPPTLAPMSAELVVLATPGVRTRRLCTVQEQGSDMGPTLERSRGTLYSSPSLSACLKVWATGILHSAPTP